MRISKDRYYLEVAKTVSLRSTCLRRQYGCVIVKDDEIIAAGYNGAPRNQENCCDIGKCYRIENNIPHGSQYEVCKSVHAEMNAIISASRKDMIDSTMYIFGFENGKEIYAIPCYICARLIINSGISQVVVLNGKLKTFIPSTMLKTCIQE